VVELEARGGVVSGSEAGAAPAEIGVGGVVELLLLAGPGAVPGTGATDRDDTAP
jgi:hypothetical protein